MKTSFIVQLLINGKWTDYEDFTEKWIAKRFYNGVQETGGAWRIVKRCGEVDQEL